MNNNNKKLFFYKTTSKMYDKLFFINTHEEKNSTVSVIASWD